MSELKTFYDGLSETNKEVFARMAGDLHTSSPQAKIEHLEDFLRQLKREIDEINRRREALGAALNNVVKMKEEMVRIPPDKSDLEVELMRSFLLERELELRTEIDALKPENKLEKKFDVLKRISRMKMRQRLAEKLVVEVIRLPLLPVLSRQEELQEEPVKVEGSK